MVTAIARFTDRYSAFGIRRTMLFIAVGRRRPSVRRRKMERGEKYVPNVFVGAAVHSSQTLHLWKQWQHACCSFFCFSETGFASGVHFFMTLKFVAMATALMLLTSGSNRSCPHLAHVSCPASFFQSSCCCRGCCRQEEGREKALVHTCGHTTRSSIQPEVRTSPARWQLVLASTRGYWCRYQIRYQQFWWW